MIDTEAKLAGFLHRLRAAKWIAVDTEADSLHAYPEKLCLIQVGIPGEEVLLDPLAPMDLAPALEELRRHELILHGGDYDLRLLWRTFQFRPSAVFDTMLAARLLGCGEFGLNNLVKRFLGVTLEKGAQKANWARRPLTPRMEVYARNDVHHLKSLAEILQAQLQDKGRLDWHREWCAQLVAESVIVKEPDPDTVWRVKGSHHLSPRALGVLREIWRWREREATGSNKPPYFILPPATMVTLAETAAHAGDVAGAIPRHLTDRRRGGVLKAAAHGLAVAHPPQPIRHRGHRQTDAERHRFHELERRRNHQAAALGIDPTVIASRATLLMLAKDWQKHSGELMAWQHQLLAG